MSAAASPVRSDRLLSIVLRGSAIFLFGYFTLSHWFFPRAFFEALGVRGPVLDSTFLLSQLRLIGAMVAGYSAILLLCARDPQRHRPALWVVLAVGAMCTAVFVGQVSAGTLPRPFLVNAALLAAPLVTVLGLLRRGRR